MCLRFAIILLLIMAASAALAVPSLFEKVQEGVYLVHDDTGYWASDMSKDITHQSHADYQAKKVLDLSSVPEAV
ncbi:MAG: hypothetical protein IT210_19310 [Armatimonadetes bacterium]|nr:hypothetical protein [Armatimonadota bacterium]